MNSVTIIGGGVSGLFSAYYLQKAGYSVTIIEQGSFADGCSFGNAGMIVPSHIVPLAQPGMISKGLRWMLKSTSPFYVKPRLSWDLMKWGMLFWKHSTEEHVRRSIPVLRDISLLSKKLFQELAASGEADFGWHERGLLMLYKNADTEHEMAEEAHLANQAGIVAERLTGAQVQALEPDVRVDVRGAVYYPGDAHITPNLLLKNLLSFLKNQGVQVLENEEIFGFEKEGTEIRAVQTNKGKHHVEELVIAAGAWSPVLTEKLGISLPLQGGKGYSFMLNNVTNNIKVPAIMLEARATATPMGSDLRFAGTLEVAGTDMTVNMNRVRGIVQGINNYYPELEVTLPKVESVWRGLRPCSPDGLPYIGRVRGLVNVTLATGHGMMGISLGPATGKLVSEIIAGTSGSMDINDFNPLRFG
ncbi:NAD(P)/FAD-dependent oxidoreductase [Runella slithyformis]|uniref:D-amino-acid dehydrogenase n=1 Tax=Runella slithyformis (strain ATCC 29530 / DSM 19594 / LMG 11500 / NCIMB 11436 / LSU 4) TaxID=761193 RepID=A0A7U4E704_RUNSL|nr:FAD-dependent oxidoreductase [Runella slithyformis]AEI50163.1 D-amino-acid dehydrogenase [Runella slithyformis DSM 19594]